MPTVEHVWYGGGAGSMLVRAALWPLARAYDAAMTARSRLYDAGVLDSAAPDLPTISVGNLTVGGTGKTPFAAWLAFKLKTRARPAIALRGYGGDETLVHGRLNPGIPVVVNPDRGAAVREAKSQGADIVVLDDAFQHRRIARNADIVVLSAEQLLRPHRMLPAGPWRERLPSARRADLLVVTRKSATSAETARATEMVRIAIPDVPLVVAYLAPAELVSATDDSTKAIDELRGANVLAIAAIGEPDVFRAQLEALGAQVSLSAYRDHHRFSDDEIRAMAARVPTDSFAVCTLKDAVKLAGRWPGPSRLWYVSLQLVVEQGADELDRLLKRVLDARAANTAATTTAG
jgi:tetraacyldisaccharide 4'-kinase